MSQRDDDLKLVGDLAKATGLSIAETISLIGEVSQVMLRVVAAGSLRNIKPLSVAVALGTMAEIVLGSAADEAKVDLGRLHEQYAAVVAILHANSDATWHKWTKSQN